MYGLGIGSKEYRIEALEAIVGRPAKWQGTYTPIHERLDQMETVLNELLRWKRRVEGQLGVEEVINGDGQHEFLRTDTTELRGHVKKHVDVDETIE